MSGQSVFRRNVENFRGLDQSATDITRELNYADVATNITHLRNDVLAKREGCQPQSLREAQIGYGTHTYEFAKDSRTFFTGFKAPGSTTTLDYTGAATTPAWTNASNITADDAAYASSTTSGSNVQTDWLIGHNFGFDIPEDAYISGVAIKFQYKVSGTVVNGVGTITRYFTFTDDSGTTVDGEERYVSALVNTSEAEDTLGGEDALWTSLLTPTIVNTSAFGVAHRSRASLADSTNHEIDIIQVGLYYRTLVPETKEELLAIGNSLYRQANGTFAITNSTGGDVSVSILPSSGAGYEVSLKEAGVAVSGWPKTYDTGSSYDTLGTLYTDISAESGWSVTATPIARVDGAVSTDTSVTVDSSPQTFSDNTRVGIPDSLKGYTIWRHVHEVSGTPSLELDAEISVADNEWLGLGREPVSSLPITEETTISNGSSLTLTVPYLEGVPSITATETFARFQGSFDGPVGVEDRPFFDTSYSGNIGQRNFSFVNARSVAYFGVPFYLNKGLPSFSQNGVRGRSNTGLWKYDGLTTYGAGLPLPPDDFAPVNTVAGGSLQNATYKYAFQLSHTDFRGNIVDGPVLDESISNSLISVTIGGTASFQEFDWDHLVDAGVWNCRYAEIGSSTTQSGVNTITVESGHSLIPGVRVLLWDEDNSEYTERLVTETTRTSITIDGDPVGVDGTSYRSLSDRFFISTMKLVVWRTEGDGTIYYFAGERPVANGTIRFLEGVADSSLGEQLIFPDRSPTPFPKLAYLTTHQGLIVGSGNPDAPETVYFADAINFESSPDSTSSFNVLGGGKVTAVASDSDDMLAVFKDRHYFNVVGDLDSLSFQVIEVSKGEFGCPSHHALVKTKNTLIFPSETGFRAIASGQLVSNFDERLIDDFSYNYYLQTPGTAIASEDQDKLVIKRAVAAYNEGSAEYICYVPAETGTPEAGGSLRPNSNSIIFIYNAEKDSWYKWSLPTDNNMAGGITIFKRRPWWCSRIYDSEIQGQVHKQKRARNQYDYSDDVTAITETLRMTWDSLENPSSWFRVVFLNLMQFRPSEYLTSFTWTANEYRNFDESTKYTQATRTFDSSSDRQKRIKMKSGKCSSISLELTNSTIFERPLITGYEYTVVPVYKQEARWGRGD